MLYTFVFIQPSSVMTNDGSSSDFSGTISLDDDGRGDTFTVESARTKQRQRTVRSTYDFAIEETDESTADMVIPKQTVGRHATKEKPGGSKIPLLKNKPSVSGYKPVKEF